MSEKPKWCSQQQPNRYGLEGGNRNANSCAKARPYTLGALACEDDVCVRRVPQVSRELPCSGLWARKCAPRLNPTPQPRSDARSVVRSFDTGCSPDTRVASLRIDNSNERLQCVVVWVRDRQQNRTRCGARHRSSVPIRLPQNPTRNEPSTRVTELIHSGRQEIFSLRMRYARVVRFTPNFAAAPSGPAITQFEARSARRTCSRLASSRVLSLGLCSSH